jgi:hypothetical protein
MILVSIIQGKIKRMKGVRGKKEIALISFCEYLYNLKK